MTVRLCGWTWAAHPRVSGENLVGWVLTRAGDGSSPRERGKLEALARKNAEDRLIPA